MQLFIKKVGSGNSISIIYNEEMNNIIKIVTSLEESGLSIKSVCKAIKNEVKEQKGAFLGMLLGTLGTSLSRNLSTDKGAIATSQGQSKIRADECAFRSSEVTLRAGQSV